MKKNILHKNDVTVKAYTTRQRTGKPLYMEANNRLDLKGKL